MQNLFLHPAIVPTSSDDGTSVISTTELVRSFRKHGIKVAWVNWGLNNFDLLTLSPSAKLGFYSTVNADQSIVSDRGMVEEGNQTVEAGGELMAGSWNFEPYGPLKKVVQDGVAAGTDLQFNKNRLSGLWGAQTPFGMWLQENEITTIFIGGVDADQCVRSMFMDTYFKGYDFI
ncbi:hypothetical protein GQ53DRAFT_888082 [Thozetella sp. PMI_491]|nr:hypothetical protein GQ53DRAFT_888082 [Thozetella sp. PMI_491]